jgi:hypothetical protein
MKFSMEFHEKFNLDNRFLFFLLSLRNSMENSMEFHEIFHEISWRKFNENNPSDDGKFHGIPWN